MALPALPLIATGANLLLGGGASPGTGLNPVTAALNAPAQLFKLGTGIAQGIRARRLGRTERPTYQIPQAAQEAMQMAQQRALASRLPGEAIMQENIDRQLAQTARGVSGLGAGSAERLAAFGVASQAAMDQQRQLGLSRADMQLQNQLGLQDQLNQFANWQEREFRYNLDEPYRNAMAAAAREGNASNLNISGALKELGGTVASTIGTQGGVGGMQAMTANPGVNPQTMTTPGPMPSRPIPQAPSINVQRSQIQDIPELIPPNVKNASRLNRYWRNPMMMANEPLF